MGTGLCGRPSHSGRPFLVGLMRWPASVGGQRELGYRAHHRPVWASRHTAHRASLFPAPSAGYGPVVLPLGFRFDVGAVLVDGLAHRRDSERLSDPRPERALSVSAAGIYVAERCPRACGRCRPGFETLLRYGRPAAAS